MYRIISIASVFILYQGIRIVAGNNQPKGVYSISIQRHETNVTKLVRLNKYGKLAKIRQLSTVGQQTITDSYNLLYYGTIMIGTPSVAYTVLMDTGSSDLWLASTLCTNCQGMNPIYNPQSSSSSVKVGTNFFELSYGNFAANVTLIKDVACITAGLCYPTQQFGMAAYVYNFQEYGISGVLGLAWRNLSEENVTPFVQNILSQLTEPLFTIWLNSIPISSTTDVLTNGGAITFGGLDTTHCSSNVYYVPVAPAAYWQFTLGGVTSGTFSQTTSWQAISDTGTDYIYGPNATVYNMALGLGATYTDGTYLLPCNGNYPPVILTIGGHQFSIPSSIYLYEYSGTTCFFGFGYLENYPFQWLLGDPWIRAVCNVYNFGTQQIGFAQSLTIGAASTSIPTTTKPPPTTSKPPTTKAPPPTSASSKHSCQTCPISAMNFTWPASAFNPSTIVYAPQVTYSINATTGCAQIALDCTCNGGTQVYIFEYSNGATYNSGTPSPAIFGCNGAAQLWQNNYASPSSSPITATNFVCYRGSDYGPVCLTTTMIPPTTTSKSSCPVCAPCQTSTMTKPPSPTTTSAACGHSCQTCPISAMNFTWSRSFGAGEIQYAPAASVTINATTGCAQLLLTCSSAPIGGAAPAMYIYYTNGVSFYYTTVPVLFTCNANAQLWQNNYSNTAAAPITATNFICYGATQSG